MLTMKTLGLIVLLLVGGACRQGTERETARDTGMAGMEGMRGGARASGSTQMMADMDAHLSVMRSASADSMKAMLPTHRQMVANLIAQLERDMRQMNMTGDAAWNATLDSLRQDLRVMPDLSPQAVRDVMPAHAGRVGRVMDMHKAMMTGMGH